MPGRDWAASASTAHSVPAHLVPAFIDSTREALVHGGSSYGGWRFVPHLLTSDSVVYSFGIGTDISWDLKLIDDVGCDIHAFDDTPVSNAWLERTLRENRWPEKAQHMLLFHHHHYLLGAENGNMTIDLPVGHGVSFAAVATGGARQFQGHSHTVEARTLESLMRMLKHTRLDLLKVDIESAEFGLFNALLATRSATAPARRLPVCQLLIEFHSRLSPQGYAAKAQELLALHSLGFELIHNVVEADTADNAILFNPRFCPASSLDMLLANPSKFRGGQQREERTQEKSAEKHPQERRHSRKVPSRPPPPPLSPPPHPRLSCFPLAVQLPFDRMGLLFPALFPTAATTKT